MQRSSAPVSSSSCSGFFIFQNFLKKGVDICSIMDYTKQVVSERAITTEKDMAV